MMSRDFNKGKNQTNWKKIHVRRLITQINLILINDHNEVRIFGWGQAPLIPEFVVPE